MNNGHTETPWEHAHEFEPREYGLRKVIAISSRGEVIAHVNCGFERGMENAQFIVHACNMHDKLVTALTKCFEVLDCNPGDHSIAWRMAHEALSEVVNS